MADLVGQIIAYEQGELNGEEETQLFADLVSSGLAWQLQGAYGRRAAQLIDAGAISPEGENLDGALEGE